MIDRFRNALLAWGFDYRYNTNEIVISGKHNIKKPRLNDLFYELPIESLERIALPSYLERRKPPVLSIR